MSKPYVIQKKDSNEKLYYLTNQDAWNAGTSNCKSFTLEEAEDVIEVLEVEQEGFFTAVLRSEVM